MIKKIFLLTAILILFCSSYIQAAVTTSPSSFKAPRDRQTTKSVTWNLVEPSTPTIPPIYTSTSGTFYEHPLNQTINLGSITKSVAVTLSYNNVTFRYDGSESERVTVPISVLKRAEQNGLKTIYFVRTFGSLTQPQGSVSIRLTSPASGELKITRMRLYFENKRGEITVNRNEKGLKSFADISYTGKGLLKGYWEVDNRIISYVNKHLVYGRKLTIETPDTPDLPTFSEGTHTVKFIIQSPDQGSTMPKAIYYVRPFEAIEIIPIAQISPYNRAPVDYSSFNFKWGADDDLTTYLLEFTDSTNESPIFSAYTRNAEYALPPYVLKYYFKAGKRYFWKIKGFNSEDIIAGESDMREFRFRVE